MIFLSVQYSPAFADHTFRGLLLEHTSISFEGFAIDYRNYGADIENIKSDADDKKLILNIYVDANPAFVEIDLPRELIDSVSDGIDQNFVVIYDGSISTYDEIETTSTFRTLYIPVGTNLPNYSDERQVIEIIGTHLLGIGEPEAEPPFVVLDDSTGGDCEYFGEWHSSSKTCTLTKNLFFDETSGIHTLKVME